MWSELAQWNAELAGRDDAINVHARRRSSGTTEVFTRALASFSEAFAAAPGVSSASSFEWRCATLRGGGVAGFAS